MFTDIIIPVSYIVTKEIFYNLKKTCNTDFWYFSPVTTTSKYPHPSLPFLQHTSNDDKCSCALQHISPNDQVVLFRWSLVGSGASLLLIILSLHVVHVCVNWATTPFPMIKVTTNIQCSTSCKGSSMILAPVNRLSILKLRNSSCLTFSIKEGRPFLGKPSSPINVRAKYRFAVRDPTYHKTAQNLQRLRYENICCYVCYRKEWVHEATWYMLKSSQEHSAFIDCS